MNVGMKNRHIVLYNDDKKNFKIKYNRLKTMIELDLHYSVTNKFI